jgi:hypothetical protein
MNNYTTFIGMDVHKEEIIFLNAIINSRGKATENSRGSI